MLFRSLLPPFTRYGNYVNEENWVISGSVDVSEDQIIIVPPIQQKAGSIWNTAEYPKDNFSVGVFLSVIHPQPHGGFCIWFNKELVTSGPFYGGPPKLDGIAIVGEVGVDNKEKNILNVHLIQSNGDVDLFTAVLPKPFVTFELNEEMTDIILEMKIENNAVKILAGDNIEDPLTEVTNEKIISNIAGNYFGVSAVTNEQPCGIALNGVASSFMKPKKNMSKKERKESKKNYNEYKKESNNVFRSPELKELGNELELAIKFEGNVENSIFDNVKNDKIFS